MLGLGQLQIGRTVTNTMKENYGKHLLTAV